MHIHIYMCIYIYIHTYTHIHTLLDQTVPSSTFGVCADGLAWLALRSGPLHRHLRCAMYMYR